MLTNGSADWMMLLIGSVPETPRPMFGNAGAVQIGDLEEPRVQNAAPILKVCFPLTQVKVSVSWVTGLLRVCGRLLLISVVGLNRPVGKLTLTLP